ncbi:meiotic recombination-related protein [Rhizoctonia solani AG-1 IA]|uniref:Meiotic recombination-related protein n=1 Tax=Thanatephorus cucumeris (strain AG1-IA) TaxID=983506 RepID=L8WVV7_THACA|nr:meiotic recombination-related protein [Rhizoctonia solani AG-1 IA]
MQVNADALASLQVFDDETHASIHSDKTKEGHSLFQLLNHTSTYLGRSLLRRWCLRPSLSITTINARHAAIQCFLLPENMSAASTIRANLRGLCQMPKTMALLRTGRGRLPEWRGVFAYHVNLLKDAVRELSDYENIGAVNQVRVIPKIIAQVLKNEKLLKALDEVNTEEMGALVNSVHRGQFELQLAVMLFQKVHVARQVSQNVPEGYTNELNVLYFPQLGKYMDLLRNDLLSFYHQGYLIRIPTPSGWTTHNDFEQIPQWNFQVAKDKNVVFQIGEKSIPTNIWSLNLARRSEIEIMEETLNRVLEYDKKIIAVCEAAAEVDCWVRPEMCEDNVIDIRGGTHPLQALLVPTFVDNDAYLVGGQGIRVEKGNYEEAMKSIMICTGANACGKVCSNPWITRFGVLLMSIQSVYLKQNALIPFMAQIGWWVIKYHSHPNSAHRAFMIDLAQVSLALRNCTARSLIILDEVSGNTPPNISTSTGLKCLADGAGLFAGVIKLLLKRGDECPKVFASTHFHELFTRGVIPPELPISYTYMKVLLDGNVAQEGQRRAEMTYLYNTILSHNEIGVLLDEGMSEEQVEELEAHAAICQRFISWKMSPGDNMGTKGRLREVLKK